MRQIKKIKKESNIGTKKGHLHMELFKEYSIRDSHGPGF